MEAHLLRRSLVPALVDRRQQLEERAQDGVAVVRVGWKALAKLDDRTGMGGGLRGVAVHKRLEFERDLSRAAGVTEV